jgi:hypothetical protein
MMFVRSVAPNSPHVEGRWLHARVCASRLLCRMFADMMISCRSFHIFAFREGETTFSGDLKYLSQSSAICSKTEKVTDGEMKREKGLT